MVDRCDVPNVFLRWLRCNDVTKPCAIDRSRAADASWYQEHYPAPNRRGDIAIWNLEKIQLFTKIRYTPWFLILPNLKQWATVGASRFSLTVERSCFQCPHASWLKKMWLFSVECDTRFFQRYDEGGYQISTNHKNSPKLNELERALTRVKILACNFEKQKS